MFRSGLGARANSSLILRPSTWQPLETIYGTPQGGLMQKTWIRDAGQDQNDRYQLK